MKNYLTKLILILCIIFALSFTYAQDYYANVTFEIQPEGSTIISGATNYQNLSQKTTHELTLKNGKTWTFFIDENTPFSAYTYKIILPKYAKIQRIQTQSTYFIQTQNDKIIIEGFGENISFEINIDYTINQIPSNEFLTQVMLAGSLGLILIIVLLIRFKKIRQKISQNNNMKEFETDALSERQLAIVKEMENKNGKITQAELQKILSLPKASLFRNILGLEKKEY
jgi:uncharacterized membrane protein